VKVPNDTAPIVRETIEKALFDYYNVSSLEQLNQVVDDGSGDVAATDEGSDIEFGSDFDPLVTEDEEPDPEGTLEDIPASRDADETSAVASTESTSTGASETAADSESSTPAEANPPEHGGKEPTQASGAADESAPGGDDGTGTPAADAGDGVEPATSEDLSTVADRLEELTEAVDRQNELLTRQHRAIKQLVDELQSE